AGKRRSIGKGASGERAPVAAVGAGGENRDTLPPRENPGGAEGELERTPSAPQAHGPAEPDRRLAAPPQRFAWSKPQSSPGPPRPRRPRLTREPARHARHEAHGARLFRGSGQAAGVR